MSAGIIRKRREVPAGVFGKARQPGEREATAPELGWELEASDVFELTVPPGHIPVNAFPDIESALLAATEQVTRTPSSPELPTLADPHRRPKRGA